MIHQGISNRTCSNAPLPVGVSDHRFPFTRFGPLVRKGWNGIGHLGRRHSRFDEKRIPVRKQFLGFLLICGNLSRNPVRAQWGSWVGSWVPRNRHPGRIYLPWRHRWVHFWPWSRCWIPDAGSCVEDVHKFLVDILGFGRSRHPFCRKWLQEILLLVRGLILIRWGWHAQLEAIDRIQEVGKSGGWKSWHWGSLLVVCIFQTVSYMQSMGFTAFERRSGHRHLLELLS